MTLISNGRKLFRGKRKVSMCSSLSGVEAKFKWCYKLVSMPEDRYLEQLYSQEWNIKPCRGRQRNTRGRVVDELDICCIRYR